MGSNIQDALREMPKVPYIPPRLPKAADWEQLLRGMDARLRPAATLLNKEYDKEFRK